MEELRHPAPREQQAVVSREPSTAWAAPNRIPWPPLIYVAAAAAAVGLDLLLPVVLWPLTGPLVLLGWAILLGAIGLDIAAMRTMARQRANIFPHRAATALVTSGPFAWSRNPIYLGNTLALGGAALAFSNPWFLMTGLPAAIAVTHLAIKREEAHMAARFGAAWVAYARRTGRWVGS